MIITTYPYRSRFDIVVNNTWAFCIKIVKSFGDLCNDGTLDFAG